MAVFLGRFYTEARLIIMDGSFRFGVRVDVGRHGVVAMVGLGFAMVTMGLRPPVDLMLASTKEDEILA